jgi:UDP-N-acetylmuramate dehydrogenase
LFAEPADLAELRELLSLVPADLEIVVLGRGSNVVISDRGIDGLVVKLGHSFQAIAIEAGGNVVAGAAAALPKLARSAAGSGRAGLGFFVGIPGSVGGAVRMNAGGHGSDTASVLIDALVLDTTTGQIIRSTPRDLGLAYRHSDLSDTDIVVQATFATTAGDVGVLEDELREVTRWRKANQPGGTLNAGSVFKNPEGDAAGAIIERCGLKGERVGPVEVSRVHANFLVAADGATADDIFSFVHHIRSIVRDKTGIDLEPEIRFLGEFARQEHAP